MFSRLSSNLAIVTACAMAGLACMFGGIWLSDAQLITAESVQGGIFTMRICTLIIYLVFFALTYRFIKRPNADIRLLFGPSSAAGLVLFAVGALLMFFVVPSLAAGSVTRFSVATLAVFCIKTIGAPVSVGLVCVFARLDRVNVMRACVVGMLGAFALYSLFSQASLFAGLSKQAIVTVSAGLLALAMLCGWIGLGGTPELSRKRNSVKPVVGASFQMPGVVKRPWRKVFTPGVILELVFSAMMLGILRNGLTNVDPHADPVSFGALVVLLLAAAFWKGLNTEHVFYAGLICAAVGVLMEPQIEYLFPGGSDFLFGLGVACFEVVMWSLVVWVTRNSDLTLMAASGARLVAVVGHLLGTVLVVVAVYFATTQASALQAAEMFMILLYFILMIVLLKFPSLKAPFSSPSDASEYSEDSAYGVAQAVVQKDREDEGEPLPVPFVKIPSDDELANRTFDSYVSTIAETYGLTARETEVLGLIAHGRNMPYMESELYISRNTLKMHIRHIYTKLDVHSKQEIIDMVESLAHT